MLEPQDCQPLRWCGLSITYQRMRCEAVVGDGWAVWRHGYVGRVTRRRYRASQSER